MKHIISTFVAVAMICLAGACSSGSGKNQADIDELTSQAERINLDLAQMAEECPMFLAGAGASFENDTMNINIEFADPIIKADMLSDVLIRYALGQYLKAHTGENLDITLNTLGKIEGIMTVTLTDINGQAKVLDIPSATLKKLVTTKQLELGCQEARSNILDILDTRCEDYRKAVNAKSCEFKYQNKFAQYTLTFEKESHYANQTQGSLTGRYLNVLRPTYDNFGVMRPFVIELINSVEIDGYRFVYQAEDGSKTIHTTIPWRLL